MRVAASPFWKSMQWLGKAGTSHQGEPCKPGWTQAATGCIPNTKESAVAGGQSQAKPFPAFQSDPSWDPATLKIRQQQYAFAKNLYEQLQGGKQLSNKELADLPTKLKPLSKYLLDALYSNIVNSMGKGSTKVFMMNALVNYANQKATQATPTASKDSVPAEKMPKNTNGQPDVSAVQKELEKAGMDAHSAMAAADKILNVYHDKVDEYYNDGLNQTEAKYEAGQDAQAAYKFELDKIKGKPEAKTGAFASSAPKGPEIPKHSDGGIDWTAAKNQLMDLGYSDADFLKTYQAYNQAISKANSEGSYAPEAVKLANQAAVAKWQEMMVAKMPKPSTTAPVPEATKPANQLPLTENGNFDVLAMLDSFKAAGMSEESANEAKKAVQKVYLEVSNKEYENLPRYTFAEQDAAYKESKKMGMEAAQKVYEAQIVYQQKLNDTNSKTESKPAAAPKQASELPKNEHGKPDWDKAKQTLTDLGYSASDVEKIGNAYTEAFNNTPDSHSYKDSVANGVAAAQKVYQELLDKAKGKESKPASQPYPTLVNGDTPSVPKMIQALTKAGMDPSQAKEKAEQIGDAYWLAYQGEVELHGDLAATKAAKEAAQAAFDKAMGGIQSSSEDQLPIKDNKVDWDKTYSALMNTGGYSGTEATKLADEIYESYHNSISLNPKEYAQKEFAKLIAAGKAKEAKEPSPGSKARAALPLDEDGDVATVTIKQALKDAGIPDYEQATNKVTDAYNAAVAKAVDEQGIPYKEAKEIGKKAAEKAYQEVVGKGKIPVTDDMVKVVAKVAKDYGGETLADTLENISNHPDSLETYAQQVSENSSLTVAQAKAVLQQELAKYQANAAKNAQGTESKTNLLPQWSDGSPKTGHVAGRLTDEGGLSGIKADQLANDIDLIYSNTLEQAEKDGKTKEQAKQAANEAAQKAYEEALSTGKITPASDKASPGESKIFENNNFSYELTDKSFKKDGLNSTDASSAANVVDIAYADAYQQAHNEGKTVAEKKAAAKEAGEKKYAEMLAKYGKGAAPDSAKPSNPLPTMSSSGLPDYNAIAHALDDLGIEDFDEDADEITDEFTKVKDEALDNGKSYLEAKKLGIAAAQKLFDEKIAAAKGGKPTSESSSTSFTPIPTIEGSPNELNVLGIFNALKNAGISSYPQVGISIGQEYDSAKTQALYDGKTVDEANAIAIKVAQELFSDAISPAKGSEPTSEGQPIPLYGNDLDFDKVHDALLAAGLSGADATKKADHLAKVFDKDPKQAQKEYNEELAGAKLGKLTKEPKPPEAKPQGLDSSTKLAIKQGAEVLADEWGLSATEKAKYVSMSSNMLLDSYQAALDKGKSPDEALAKAIDDVQQFKEGYEAGIKEKKGEAAKPSADIEMPLSSDGLPSWSGIIDAFEEAGVPPGPESSALADQVVAAFHQGGIEHPAKAKQKFKEIMADLKANGPKKSKPSTGKLPPPIPKETLKAEDPHKEGSPWGKLKPGKKGTYGSVMFNDKGEVLLREPANHYLGYAWTFPKGGANSGEHPYDTGVRESVEETGYEPNVVGYVPGGFQGTGSSDAFFYLATPGAYDEAKMKANGETWQTKWVSIDEAKKLIGESTTEAGKKRDLAVLDAAHKQWQKLQGIAPSEASESPGAPLAALEKGKAAGPPKESPILKDGKFDNKTTRESLTEDGLTDDQVQHAFVSVENAYLKGMMKAADEGKSKDEQKAAGLKAAQHKYYEKVLKYAGKVKNPTSVPPANPDKDIVSFDFDGVLHTDVTEDPKHPGVFHNQNYSDWKKWTPNSDVLESLKKMAANGHKIIITTARGPESIAAMWKFIHANDLPIEEIYATNKGDKKPVLEKAGAKWHYDDSPKVQDQLKDWKGHYNHVNPKSSDPIAMPDGDEPSATVKKQPTAPSKSEMPVNATGTPKPTAGASYKIPVNTNIGMPDYQKLNAFLSSIGYSQSQANSLTSKIKDEYTNSWDDADSDPDLKDQAEEIGLEQAQKLLDKFIAEKLAQAPNKPKEAPKPEVSTKLPMNDSGTMYKGSLVKKAFADAGMDAYEADQMLAKVDDAYYDAEDIYKKTMPGATEESAKKAGLKAAQEKFEELITKAKGETPKAVTPSAGKDALPMGLLGKPNYGMITNKLVDLGLSQAEAQQETFKVSTAFEAAYQAVTDFGGDNSEAKQKANEAGAKIYNEILKKHKGSSPVTNEPSKPTVAMELKGNGNPSWGAIKDQFKNAGYSDSEAFEKLKEIKHEYDYAYSDAHMDGLDDEDAEQKGTEAAQKMFKEIMSKAKGSASLAATPSTSVPVPKLKDGKYDWTSIQNQMIAVGYNDQDYNNLLEQYQDLKQEYKDEGKSSAESMKLAEQDVIKLWQEKIAAKSAGGSTTPTPAPKPVSNEPLPLSPSGNVSQVKVKNQLKKAGMDALEAEKISVEIKDAYWEAYNKEPDEAAGKQSGKEAAEKLYNEKLAELKGKVSSNTAAPKPKTAKPIPPEPKFLGVDPKGNHWVAGKLITKDDYDKIMGVKLPTQGGYLKPDLVKAELKKWGWTDGAALDAKVLELNDLYYQKFNEGKAAGLDESSARKAARAFMDPNFREALLKGIIKPLPLTSGGGPKFMEIMDNLEKAGFTDKESKTAGDEIEAVFHSGGIDAATDLYNEKLLEAKAAQEAEEAAKAAELNKPAPIGIDTTPALAEMPDSLDAFQFVKNAGGGSGADAKQVKGPNGKLYVQKSGQKSPGQITSEVDADKIYNLLGFVAPVSKVIDKDGVPYKVGTWIEGDTVKQALEKLGVDMKGKGLAGFEGDTSKVQALRKEIQNGFVADCLFANWDVTGPKYDNTVITPDGKAARIDNGGALMWKGIGAPKGSSFGTEVTEIEKMRDPYTNPQTSQIYGDVKGPDGKVKFEGISLLDIQKQVKDIWLKRNALLKSLPAGQVRTTIAKRLDWLKEHYGPKSTKKSVAANSIYSGLGADWPAKPPNPNNPYIPKPTELGNIIFKNYSPNDVRKGFGEKDYAQSFKDHQMKVVNSLSGSERSQIKGYTDSTYGSFNFHMRKCPEDLNCLDADDKKLNEAVEKGIAAAGQFAQPVTIWRNSTLTASSQAGKDFLEVAQYALETGDDLRIPAVKSCSMTPDKTVGGGDIKLEIKAKTGVWVEKISGLGSQEAEILQGHNTRYRVVSVKKASEYPAGCQWGIPAKYIIQLEEL